MSNTTRYGVLIDVRRVATAWCFPICRAARRWDAPSTRPLGHPMEADGRKAVPAPRPRLLEALRDYRSVKSAIADGAVRQSCRSRAANPVTGGYKLHAAGDADLG